MGVTQEGEIREANIENENASSTLSSPIQEFYTDCNILITGATGFIGKALVEKLLRSCYYVDIVYLLIRPKRGLDVKTRQQQLINNQVFDRIRSENPSLFKKIRCISGDVQEQNLGLSDTDKQMLIENVNVVFHSAATVRFNETLNEAVVMNTMGTMKLVQLCRDIKHLKAFVHVSTAFSNADKHEVLECVYPSPTDPDYVASCCSLFEGKDLEDITNVIRGKHPNTYTLTKAMAECIVSQTANELAAAIVRPSIVTAAWKEPVPGWVDNLSGITGIMMEIGRGTIRSIICDQTLVMDMIPVDIVVNTLITAAWHVYHHKSQKVRVYNCVSGTLNPVKWYDYGRMTEKHSLQVPSKYVQWYPGFTFRTNRTAHFIAEIFLHFLPAIFVDILLRLKGLKPIMFNIAKKFKHACKNGEFFALHEWKFECENILLLKKEISYASDSDCFNVDVSPMNWDTYVKYYMMGIRKYVMKDSTDSLPGARRKLRRLYLVNQMLKIILLFVIIKLFHSILLFFTNY